MLAILASAFFHGTFKCLVRSSLSGHLSALKVVLYTGTIAFCRLIRWGKKSSIAIKPNGQTTQTIPPPISPKSFPKLNHSCRYSLKKASGEQILLCLRRIGSRPDRQGISPGLAYSFVLSYLQMPRCPTMMDFH
jgi:hypothetical protein